MPINFTVVPVEDAEGSGGGNSSSSVAAVGEGSRPVSLGKIFRVEEDDDNSQGPHSGKDTV